MKTSVHFVAMPLAYPFHPSSQLGYLHGYAVQTFGDRVSVRSHHAFLPILHRASAERMGEFFERYSLVGEEILYLCCALSAWNHNETDFPPAASFDEAFERYHNYSAATENESQQHLVPITREQITALTEAMEHYVEQHLASSLQADGLNLIGFTASFCQVLGSIFAARHLSRVSDRRSLFLFGGSSFSLPEGRRTLAAWGVDGLIVKGSGEAPLERIISAALALPDNTEAGQVLVSLADSAGENVTRVAENHRDVELALAQKFLDHLPDPDYGDYFSQLHGLCRDETTFRTICSEFVSLPIEGSRGCYAKCDFCHNPNITSEFRSLTGIQVAERALRLTRRHAVNDVTFVDSVSNTWAEGYADYLLDRNIHLPAFMELRVHEPELFWSKMALCGATTLQLGIEAISPALLRAMRKGTSVIQNLAATKFMAEFGIRDASNLIIHHPRSTVADILETIRIMQLCEHLPVFNLSRFVVSYASPLYNQLPEEKKALLGRGFDWLESHMEPYGWPRHLSYTWRNSWTEPKVTEAWLHFQEWYATHVRELAGRPRPPSFTVTRDGDGGLQLEDNRFATEYRSRLEGLPAQVVDACHQPRKLWHMLRDIDVTELELRDCLSALEERRILVRVEEDYLTLALRGVRERIVSYRDAMARPVAV